MFVLQLNYLLPSSSVCLSFLILRGPSSSLKALSYQSILISAAAEILVREILNMHFFAAYFILWMMSPNANAHTEAAPNLVANARREHIYRKERSLEARNPLDLMSEQDPTFFLDDNVIGWDPMFDTYSNVNAADNIGLLSMTESDPNRLGADTFELKQLAEPGSNWLFTDDIDLDPGTEPASSSFLAGDLACDISDTNDIQLFGKVRREAFCPTPPDPLVGQTGDQNNGQPEQGSSNSDKPQTQSEGGFVYDPVGFMFPERPRCLPSFDNTRTRPVCKDIVVGEVIPEFGEQSFTLFDVLPCMSGE